MREAYEIRQLALKLTQPCGSTQYMFENECIQGRPGNSGRVSVDQVGRVPTYTRSLLQINTREYVTKLFATQSVLPIVDVR